MSENNHDMYISASFKPRQEWMGCTKPSFVGPPAYEKIQRQRRFYSIFLKWRRNPIPGTQKTVMRRIAMGACLQSSAMRVHNLLKDDVSRTDPSYTPMESLLHRIVSFVEVEESSCQSTFPSSPFPLPFWDVLLGKGHQSVPVCLTQKDCLADIVRLLHYSGART